MRIRSYFIAAALLACSPFSGAVAGAPCEDPAYRQFDFWIGDWDVRTPDGKLAGQNRIAREYAGCVIHERYTTERGYSGESLNTYDPGRKVWHQTWVDNEGTLLVLEGRAHEGAMKLEGESVATNGKRTRHRITWTPNKDGGLRQFWESTDDDGRWVVAFDGRYTRR